MRFEHWGARRSALKLIYFAALFGVMWAGFLPLCNLIFDCGCKVAWAGAATQCNIHTQGMKHCPLCTVPYFYDGVLLGIAVTQGWLVWRGSRLWDYALAFFAFPLIGTLSSLVLGWYVGYW
jgi:hypothetical protein